MFVKKLNFLSFLAIFWAKSSNINSNNLFSLKMRADMNSTPLKTYRNMYYTYIN